MSEAHLQLCAPPLRADDPDDAASQSRVSFVQHAIEAGTMPARLDIETRAQSVEDRDDGAQRNWRRIAPFDAGDGRPAHADTAGDVLLAQTLSNAEARAIIPSLPRCTGPVSRARLHGRFAAA